MLKAESEHGTLLRQTTYNVKLELYQQVEVQEDEIIDVPTEPTNNDGEADEEEEEITEEDNEDDSTEDNDDGT